MYTINRIFDELEFVSPHLKFKRLECDEEIFPSLKEEKYIEKRVIPHYYWVVDKHGNFYNPSRGFSVDYLFVVPFSLKSLCARYLGSRLTEERWSEMRVPVELREYIQHHTPLSVQIKSINHVKIWGNHCCKLHRATRSWQPAGNELIYQEREIDSETRVIEKFYQRNECCAGYEYETYGGIKCRTYYKKFRRMLKKHGEKIEWNDDGIISRTSSFEEGVKHGLQFFYDEPLYSGEITIINYNRGEQTLTITIDKKTGQLKTIDCKSCILGFTDMSNILNLEVDSIVTESDTFVDSVKSNLILYTSFDSLPRNGVYLYGITDSSEGVIRTICSNNLLITYEYAEKCRKKIWKGVLVHTQNYLYLCHPYWHGKLTLEDLKLPNLEYTFLKKYL